MQLTVDSGQLPVGWEVKKLAEVCQIEKSQGIYTNLPYIGMENIESNTSRFIGSTEPQSVKSSTFKFSSNHVLYGRLRPYLNKVLAPDFLGHCSTEIFPIKPSECLNRNFLLYWLLMDLTVKRINATCTGARMPRANMNSVFEFDFPLPPLPEQKRIVAILDEAFEGIDRAIANTEKNLANSRELFESYLNAIFTQKNNRWEWVSLSEITTDITDGDHQPPPKSQSGIPFITISNIDKQNRRVDFSNTFKVSPEYFEKLKSNRKPRKGDLLYTVTGSYGIPVIVDHDIDFCFQRHIGLIRPNAETNSKCLYYILLSRYLLTQADECATGTAQKTVSLNGLRRFSVPKIPKEQQEIIVTELDALSEKIGRLESIYRQKIAALNELKQSILQKAFTGELTADTPKAAKERIAA